MGAVKTIAESVTGIRRAKDIGNILMHGVPEGTKINAQEYQKRASELTDAAGKTLSKIGKSLEDSAKKTADSVNAHESSKK